MVQYDKDMACDVMEDVIRNLPICFASMIPGLGNVISTIKSSYDSVKSKRDVDSQIINEEGELVDIDNKLEDIGLDKATLLNKIDEFESKFDLMKNNFIHTDEEYQIRNICCVELFFADYIDTNNEEFIDELTDTLIGINEEYKTTGIYGCVYTGYMLYTYSLKIIFDEEYDRESTDAFIDKIEVGIADGWHMCSPFKKIKYY